MIPFFDLGPSLPLMIASDQRRPVMGDGRFAGRSGDGGPAQRRCRAAGGPPRAINPAWYRRVAVARFVSLAVGEASHTHVPYGIGRPCMRQMGKSPRRNGSASPRCRVERLRRRRLFGHDPALVVEARYDLPLGRGLPGQLSDRLVLLVSSRESRIGAGLTVVVSKTMMSREKP